MTDEQINVAIAKASGWKNLHSHPLNPTVWTGDEPLDDGRYLPYTQIPDYCNDLNAMHEAEKTLNVERWQLYAAFLFKATSRPQHATARQRAEAFLRMLGKWEEVQE
jgi:hypothetical protein